MISIVRYLLELSSENTLTIWIMSVKHASSLVSKHRDSRSIAQSARDVTHKKWMNERRGRVYLVVHCQQSTAERRVWEKEKIVGNCHRDKTRFLQRKTSRKTNQLNHLFAFSLEHWCCLDRSRLFSLLGANTLSSEHKSTSFVFFPIWCVTVY